MWNNVQKLRKLERAVHLHAAAILNNHLDRPSDAVAELDAILAFDAEIAEVHSQRAQLLAKLERYEEAIASADQYLALASQEGVDFDHPDVLRASRLKEECGRALRRTGG